MGFPLTAKSDLGDSFPTTRNVQFNLGLLVLDLADQGDSLGSQDMFELTGNLSDFQVDLALTEGKLGINVDRWEKFAVL